MSDISHMIQTLGFSTDIGSGLQLGLALIVGAGLAFIVRFLYNRFNTSVSNPESISNIFVLLTLVTTAVIAVVKSSLALSLGLVGALSIVRFRAPIKDPEELVYLFLCIALGITLGAGHLQYAGILVFVVGILVVGKHYLTQPTQQHNHLITIIGNNSSFSKAASNTIMSIIAETSDHYTLQRMETDEHQTTLRIKVDKIKQDEISNLIGAMKEELPDCKISFINIDMIL